MALDRPATDPGTVVTSPRNERIRAVAALSRRKARREQGRFLVEGQHPVAEALADGWVDEVFCLPEQAERWGPLAPRTTLVDERVLGHLSDAATPQGVVAVAAIRTVALADVLGEGIVVVLCGAADPGNVGTIIRTADAVAARAVVLARGSADPFGPKVVRSTAGSLTHVPLVVDVEAVEAVRACRAAGHRTVGLEADASRRVDEDGALAAPVALVMGSEAHGLPDEVRAEVEACVSLPVYGRAESLNLAVATSLALYEAARQQRP